MRYQVGDRVTVETMFTDEAGTLQSPVTVVGEYRTPTGTVTPMSPSEQTPGVWRMTLPAFTEHGRWGWYIAGTAGLIAADQGTINVDRKVTADPT